MTTYLALARLTVGGDDRLHDRELQEGLERVIEEMVERGWSADRIERAVEDAYACNEVEA